MHQHYQPELPPGFAAIGCRFHTRVFAAGGDHPQYSTTLKGTAGNNAGVGNQLERAGNKLIGKNNELFIPGAN
jgi:hypothetical protein